MDKTVSTDPYDRFASYEYMRSRNAEVCGQRAEKHGKLYWRIEFRNGEVAMVMADRIEVGVDGSLRLIGHQQDGAESLMGIFAPRSWTECHAASCIDGGPMLVCDDDRVWRRERKMLASEKQNKPALSSVPKPDDTEKKPRRASLFGEWLKRQKGRDDPIGDLAGDVLRDKNPWDGRIRSLRMRISDTEVVGALTDAAKEYRVYVQEFRRRAKQRALVTPRLRLKVLLRDQFTCRLCGDSREKGAVLHVDHVVSVGEGGETIEANLQTLCDRCNFGKGKNPVEGISESVAPTD